MKKSYDDCPIKTLSAPLLEGVIIEQMRRILTRPEWSKSVTEKIKGNRIDKTHCCEYDPLMKNTAILIFLMLIGVAALDLLPAIEQARIIVPEEIYVDKDCGCGCILQSRPWYGRFNYWFWLWVLAVPILIFSIKPEAQKWKKIISPVIIVAFCYGVMNLALHLMWDIRNGPFIMNSDPTVPDQKTWYLSCADTGDGASLAFVLFLGWVPASVYVGMWLLINTFLKRAVSKQTTA